MAEATGGGGSGAVPLASLTGQTPKTPKMNLQQVRRVKICNTHHALVFPFLPPLQAVRDGREEVLRQWLGQVSERKKRALINAYDSFGFTAMHYATRFNRFKMMQLLVANDASKMEGERERGLCILMSVCLCTYASSKD